MWQISHYEAGILQQLGNMRISSIVKKIDSSDYKNVDLKITKTHLIHKMAKEDKQSVASNQNVEFVFRIFIIFVLISMQHL